MKHNRILILGKGYLGKRLQEDFRCPVSAAFITKLKDVYRLISIYRPKIIINCIGFTGLLNVDDCEKDQEFTIQANTFVPALLAEGALRHRIKLIHISSGCIYHYDYGRTSPIRESVIPDYFDLYYSRSKIYSERMLDVLSNQFNILTVRIRVPLDNRPNPRNILSKLIRYQKVIDLPNSVTYIPDLVKALKHLIKIDARGIYNVVNKGALRYPALLQMYQQYVPDYKFAIISYRALGLKRTNLILSIKKLEQSGFPMPKIQSAAQEAVKGYVENSRGRKYEKKPR